jgi:hypothetical protein
MLRALLELPKKSLSCWKIKLSIKKKGGKSRNKERMYEVTTESNILGCFVLDEILSSIFSEYLTIEDISRFDVAICCHTARRQAFLNLIQSGMCIFSGREQHKSGYISWLSLRHVQVRELKCDPVLSGAELLKIVDCGRWLKKLELSGCINITYMSVIRIADGCPNLIELDLSDCDNINDRNVMRIAVSHPNLVKLDISRCSYITNLSVTKIADSCPNLTDLSLRRCCNITDISIIKIAQGCPNLVKLNLSSCRNITDESVLRIAQCCSNLRDLNLTYCSNISDMSIIGIVEGCPYLRYFMFLGCNVSAPISESIRNLLLGRGMENSCCDIKR